MQNGLDIPRTKQQCVLGPLFQQEKVGQWLVGCSHFARKNRESRLMRTTAAKLNSCVCSRRACINKNGVYHPPLSMALAANFGASSDSAQPWRIAVYGTLRDDDDSAAPYTKSFLSNVQHIEAATLAGFKLFQPLFLPYPYAVHTGNPDDCIVVRLLHWTDEETFARKLKEADAIEQCDEDGVGLQYRRSMVRVRVHSNEITAFVYQANMPADAAIPDDWALIPSGDWLQRPRTQSFLIIAAPHEVCDPSDTLPGLLCCSVGVLVRHC